jgi:hypothetical protein
MNSLRFLRAFAVVASAALQLACASAVDPSQQTATDATSGNNSGNNSSNIGNNSGNNSGGTTTTAGCGTGRLECKPVITLTEKSSGSTYKSGMSIPVAAGELQAGQERVFSFSIRNTGQNGALSITKVELQYAPADGEAEAAFRCVGADKKTGCAEFKFPAIAPASRGGTTETSFEVRFRKPADEAERKAVLHVRSNDKSGDAAAQDIAITFTTVAGLPKLKVLPDFVDFDFVKVGGSNNVPMKLFNSGSADLVVPEIDASALEPGLFTLIWSGKEIVLQGTVALDPPIVVKASGAAELKAVYFAKDDKPHTGAIVLRTNDTSLQSDGGSGWKRVPFKVNTTGPCLQVNPKHIVFGATGVGIKKPLQLALKSCGDMAVEIASVEFDAPGGGPFTVDWSEIASTGGKAPSASKPLSIPVNGEVKVPVVYLPTKTSPVKDGQPIPDKAALTLKTNTVLGEAKVTMEGAGASGDCPTAVIVVQEGDTVLPQTTLHLDGKQSYATSGAPITSWQWDVVQPKGSVALFQPNKTASKVNFLPNVAGDYKFLLHVTDQAGKKSCFAAEKVVKVVPDQAIHVELLWKTPGDKDETDEGPAAGSDMDLHFAHQYAANPDYDKDGKPDPWFADIYDCFWFNKKPKWGSYDFNKDDDPSLDRDDTDGAGPENLNLTEPEEGKSYSVGVHYYNDFAKGPSTATVRVYVYGQLQFQVTSPAMVKDDLWYVANIDWPSGEVSAKLQGGKPNTFFITPKYPYVPLQ